MINRNRAWLYCRVVSGVNNEETLKHQRNWLADYAKKHELEIVGSSGDIGNGWALNRPGLREFQTAMKDGKVDVLLLFNLSRLGRNLDEVIQYWQTLREHSVRLCTVTEGETYLDMHSLFLEIFKDRAERAQAVEAH